MVQRVAVLWQSMSGYFDACLRALSTHNNTRITLAYRSPRPLAPFDDSKFGWLDLQYRWQQRPDVSRLRELLSMSRPEAVLVSSWHIGAYRALLRDLKGEGIPRVLCMDNQWLGTPKQWLGRMTWRQYIHPYYDFVFVPGDRQVRFARHLGFRDEHVMRGLYVADTDAFAISTPPPVPREKSFLFVGRLVPDKGIDVLASAYRLYRSSTPTPWPLRVCGAGPEAERLADLDGVEFLGFVQPRDLPTLMWRSSAALCPSRFEPWGVVVHEAAAAGMILVCSEAVGAGPHLCVEGYNGYVVPTDNATALARALSYITDASDARRAEMSAASVCLSKQLSPGKWARYVLEMLSRQREWLAAG